jgi:hypothetical protein
MIKLDRTDAAASAEYATVYLAFELSKAKWKLGVLLPGSQKLSRYTIDGGDLTALAARLADMRKKAVTAARGRPVRILSCYEAGLDGHWLHRRKCENAGNPEGAQQSRASVPSPKRRLQPPPILPCRQATHRSRAHIAGSL